MLIKLLNTRNAFDRIMKKTPPSFSPQEIDRIIEMAWEDRTPFEAIEFQFGIKEQAVIELMRTEMKVSSFRMWRKRVTRGNSMKSVKPETKPDTPA